jgi:hypothetical protein
MHYPIVLLIGTKLQQEAALSLLTKSGISRNRVLAVTCALMQFALDRLLASMVTIRQ